jgi:hypothetical protein
MVLMLHLQLVDQVVVEQQINLVVAHKLEQQHLQLAKVMLVVHTQEIVITLLVAVAVLVPVVLITLEQLRVQVVLEHPLIQLGD